MGGRGGEGGGGGGGRERILGRKETCVDERQAGEVDGRCNDALVMVRVDANDLELQIERVLAHLLVFQFVLVQVRIPPDSRVQHVRETLSAGHLQTTMHTGH